MWGTIENKKIKEIKESYCLGEACLIFDYDKDTDRTIAFKTVNDLKKMKEFFKKGINQYKIEVKDNILKIIYSEEIDIVLANNTHALRLKEVLDNYKR